MNMKFISSKIYYIRYETQRGALKFIGIHLDIPSPFTIGSMD